VDHSELKNMKKLSGITHAANIFAAYLSQENT